MLHLSSVCEFRMLEEYKVRPVIMPRCPDFFMSSFLGGKGQQNDADIFQTLNEIKRKPKIFNIKNSDLKHFGLRFSSI